MNNLKQSQSMNVYLEVEKLFDEDRQLIEAPQNWDSQPIFFRHVFVPHAALLVLPLFVSGYEELGGHSLCE